MNKGQAKENKKFSVYKRNSNNCQNKVKQCLKKPVARVQSKRPPIVHLHKSNPFSKCTRTSFSKENNSQKIKHQKAKSVCGSEPR